MAAFKKHLAFYVSLIVLLLLAVAGFVFIFLSAGASGGAASKLATAKNNLRSALSQSPAPTEANLEASENNVKALEEVLAEQVESTKGSNATILEQNAPTTGTNMYYDLLAYKNELDKDAKLIQPIGKDLPGVALPENFSWGFTRYLQAGAGAPPKDEDITAIFRQKVILNYLMRKLLATRPQSIVSIQREPAAVERPKETDAQQQTNQNELKPDEFWMGQDTAAVPGIVDTTAFRISFTGYTQNMRAFLKEIAAFELPLVVRSVEVKPNEEKTSTSSKKNTNNIFDIFGGSTEEQDNINAIQENQEPVVEANISQFTIVIEYIEVTIQS